MPERHGGVLVYSFNFGENIMLNVNMTIDEMKARAATLQADFEGLQAQLEVKISHGPAAAQSARLVAFALVKQAYSLFENVAGPLVYLSQPEAPADGDSIGSCVVVMLDAVVKVMKDQFGVEEAAIAPFVYEINSIFISVIEDLLAKAKVKLAEAEAFEGASDSSCMEVKE
jgi:hypothetical protein